MQVTEQQLWAWQEQVQGLSPAQVLVWTVETFGERAAFASSLGAEDQVLTDMVAKHSRELAIFTLDTGRLFPETYELMQRTEERYDLMIRIYFPDASEVEAMVDGAGINLFRQSVEKRKQCCGVRKVKPLQRALSGLDAWVCGLRREQAVTRDALEVVEWDEANQLVKINPLAAWSEDEVWAYVKANDVPVNPLHEQGFLSIGCACCTRAVAPGEDVRAGRWWWEKPEHKECGLHFKDGKLERMRG